MEFRRRQRRTGNLSPIERVALVPGSFNPPTNAHRALLEAALDRVDEAIAVLPRKFPHKSYEDTGASLEDRVRMLEYLSPVPYSIAISEGGLFLDMCDEFHCDGEPGTELYIACGRDAAERILGWNYADPGMLDRMFSSFQLLVAARQGEFTPPARFAHRIHSLGIPAEHDPVSSTEVRNRIEAGQEWRHLVPGELEPLIEELYTGRTHNAKRS
jgi:cytidyltransferase-like protein